MCIRDSQRSHHDICGRRARRYWLDRRCVGRRPRSWIFHCVLWRIHRAGLHDGGGFRRPAGAACHSPGGIGNEMTMLNSNSSRSMPLLRAAAIAILVALGFLLPQLLGGTPVAYSTLTTIAIFAVMCYGVDIVLSYLCLLYTSPSPRDRTRYRMP